MTDPIAVIALIDGMIVIEMFRQLGRLLAIIVISS